MFGLGMGEIVIVGALIFLFIGPKKLPMLGEGLGKSIKNFKKEMEDKERS